MWTRRRSKEDQPSARLGHHNLSPFTLDWLDWTGSQTHFCRGFLVCGIGRAHLFPKTRNINFGIKIFSWVAHFNMCFSGKMTETLQGTVLEFTLPSWHLHDLRCCWTFNKMIRVMSYIWAMELCEDQANYWVERVCPCLLMQRWLVSGANLNKENDRDSHDAKWLIEWSPIGSPSWFMVALKFFSNLNNSRINFIILWSMSEKASWCWKLVSVTWAEESSSPFTTELMRTQDLGEFPGSSIKWAGLFGFDLPLPGLVQTLWQAPATDATCQHWYAKALVHSKTPNWGHLN